MLDPLILALMDAKCRAQDERERAVDRTRRPAGELTEREESTLRGLLTRADAYRALEEQHTDYPENKAPYLEVMRELRDDAHEQFARYRREVGLPDPGGLTVFGQVLTELLEKRGLSAKPFDVAKLAHEAGLENSYVVARMADTDVDAGYLDALTDHLELTDEEKTQLALAYSMEHREPAPEPGE